MTANASPLRITAQRSVAPRCRGEAFARMCLSIGGHDCKCFALRITAQRSVAPQVEAPALAVGQYLLRIQPLDYAGNAGAWATVGGISVT